MFWSAVKSLKLDNSSSESLDNNLHVVKAPTWIIGLSSIFNILGNDLGYVKSLEKEGAALGNGEPIPLYSYSLIEYLMSLDLSKLEILELGGGQSTKFWAKRAKSVQVLENNAEWAGKIKSFNLDNVLVKFSPPGTLGKAMEELDKKYDMIVIDCQDNRYVCAEAAPKVLKAGGAIILDNSEWYRNAAKILRDADLIEVDFYDFRPGHHFRTVTSLFLSRDFAVNPQNKMPNVPIGGKNLPQKEWDSPQKS